MNWGKKVALILTLFIIFIGTLAYLMINSKIDIVNKNYYQEEIEFENRIEKDRNLKANDQKPTLNLNDGFLELSFINQPDNGTIEFYKPDDNALDQHLELKEDQRNQQFDIKEFKKGRWIIKLNWTSQGVPYFYKENIVI